MEEGREVMRDRYRREWGEVMGKTCRDGGKRHDGRRGREGKR